MEDVARLGLEVDSRPVSKATRALALFSKEGKKSATVAETAKKKMGGMAAAIGLAVTAALSFGAATSVIMDFDSAMSKVAAVTRATSSELSAMRDVAKRFGSTTEFSATQAGEALNFLGMAGFNAAESIATLPAVLDLATAANMDLGSSADTVSNIMSGFGIAATNAAEVTDILAAASTRANTTVSQLGQAMSTAAPIAAALGIDLASTAAAIGIMSDAGIQGERAGTALRGVLASLAGPTTQAEEALASYGVTAAQINPETVGLSQAMQTLSDAGLSTADAMTIFGREAASGALVLMEAGQRVGGFAAELRTAEGAAPDMAAIMRDNLRGDVNSLISALQGLAISLGEAGLTAILRFVTQTLTGLVRGITALTDAIGAVVGWISDFGKFETAVEGVARANDTANLAIADNLAQVNALNVAAQGGRQVSMDYAGAMLATARASLAAAEATRQNTLATTRARPEYQALVDDQRTLQQAVQDYQAILKDGISDAEFSRLAEKYAFPVTAENVEALIPHMQRALDKLRETVTAQEAFTATVGGTGEALQEAQAEIVALEEAIVKANGGVVTLGASTSEAADTTGALARLANDVDFADATQGAINLAIQLGLSVREAQSLLSFLAGIPGALASGATQIAGLNASIRTLRQGGSEIDAQLAKFRAESLASIPGLEAMQDGQRDHAVGMVDLLVEQEGSRLRNQEIEAGLLADLRKNNAAMEDIGSSTSSAANAAEDFADQVQRMNLDADPIRNFNYELRELEVLLANGLSPKAYDAALQDMNDRLADQIPMVNDVASAWGEFVAGGFKDFEGFKDKILSSFSSMIAEMVATAARNRIVLSISGGGSVAGSAASAGGVDQAASSLGTLGQLGSSFGAIGGALAGGFMNAAGAFLGAGGGFAAGFSAIGAQVGTAAALGTGTAIAAAIGAVALPLLAVAAVFTFFKSKSKDLETGIRISTEGMGSLVDSYKKVEKSKFWGLSKKVTDQFEALDAATADPITKIIGELQANVVEAAASLGIGSEAFAGFSRSFILSTKGMSEAEASEALQAELLNTQNAFSQMIPTLTDFSREGEGTTATLARLSQSIALVNPLFDRLGKDMLSISLAGGDLASTFLEVLGGIEGVNAATGTYFELYFSEAERLAFLTKDISAEFARLGLEMPDTKAGLRDLITGLDTSTHSGVIAAATLIGLSGSFSQMIDGANSAKGVVEDFSSSLSDLRSDLGSAINREASTLASNLAAAEQALQRSFSAVNTAIDREISSIQTGIATAGQAASRIKNIVDMLGDALDNRSSGSVAVQRMNRQNALAELRGGISDSRRLEKVLGTLNEPSEGLFGSFREYAFDFAKTSAVIREQQKNAEGQLSEAERQIDALNNQSRILEDQKAAILAQLNSTLGIETGVLSVEAAVRAFGEAQSTFLQEQTWFDTRTAQLEDIKAQFGILDETLQSVRSAIEALASARAASAAATAATTAGPVTAAGQQYAGMDMSANWSAEQWYIANNPDVMTAIARGQFSSAKDHYDKFGRDEGRVFGGAAFAKGGYHTGGLRIVGEGGPELEATGPSRIYSAQKTKSMLGGGGMSDALLRKIVAHLAKIEAIERENNVYNGKTATLLRRFDIVGLPPTRAAT